MILWVLWQRSAWNEKHYVNYDKCIRHVAFTVKNNGKNTKKQWKKLMKQRLGHEHKKGETCSLNYNYYDFIGKRLRKADYPV